eukprot:scaffold510393_cov51-Prasinocladus_malaysianus.AAC.1
MHTVCFVSSAYCLVLFHIIAVDERHEAMFELNDGDGNGDGEDEEENEAFTITCAFGVLISRLIYVL